MPQVNKIGEASDVFDDLQYPSRYKALYGGRGSAKSHFFAECLVANAAMNEGFRALCVREVQKSLKESSKRLIEDKIQQMGYGAHFDIKHDEIGTPGGGVISFTGMNSQNSESVKSYENYMVCWVEEASTFAARSLELLRPTIRAPGSELWFSWNPDSAADPVDKFFRGVSPPENAIIRRVNWSDNKYLPSELRTEMEQDRKNNPDRFSHIWNGDYAPQAVGAIWNMQNIHEGRRHEAPTMKRILVSVDPAISNTENSDEHGIVVVGTGEDGRGYVLDDVSLKGAPQQWAERAVATFDRYEADSIVVERNQGGDMVKHTLRSVRPGIPVTEVVATRGKHVRAEPISALYATNQVSHVGSFPELEAQMCRMTAAGYDGDGSPDRVDALVWGLTEVFPAIINKAKKRAARPRTNGTWMG
jgi:phage terminase large subunit-like protein